MGHPDELPKTKSRIKEAASLLGVPVGSIPGDERQLESLAELVEALLEKNGEEWIGLHSGVILDQWQIFLTLGI
ncbi:MAG TPA: hypothetical protein VMT71_10905 [Syntrophorhabdales bacterium]|nr:hypothetical protein [Syntrophorhabdales bacterium]